MKKYPQENYGILCLQLFVLLFATAAWVGTYYQNRSIFKETPSPNPVAVAAFSVSFVIGFVFFAYLFIAHLDEERKYQRDGGWDDDLKHPLYGPILKEYYQIW